MTRWTELRRPAVLDTIAFAAALLPRLLVVTTSGGFHGEFNTDSGVYYAAAAGLVHGRVPYLDYVLVHPPLIAYVLTPFAELGHLTSDQTGFITANVAFAVIGAVNAVLVGRIARRCGFGPRAALMGALFYALWFGSVGAEYLIRLEPLGNLVMLLGLLALARSWSGGGRIASLLAGAGLGLAMSDKIWWAAPWLVVLGWELGVRRAYRPAAWYLLGSLAVTAAVDLVPFILSGGRMWSMVVGSQLDRPDRSTGLLARIGDLTTLRTRYPGLSHHALLLIALLAFVVLVVVAGAAGAVPAARLFVALLAAQLIVLLAGPTWFAFYGDFLSVPLALVVAGAAAALLRRRRTAGRLAGWLPFAATAALTGLVLASPLMIVARVPHVAELARAARPYRCIVSDDPTVLIQFDALDRSFERGCVNWVDPSGPTLGGVRATYRVRNGYPNPAWSRHLEAYLLSGDAAIFSRPGLGLTPAGRRLIVLGGVIVTDGRYTLYRVSPAVRHRPPEPFR